ncbi:hypothetical protein NC651_010841 [Populus alba x Populus x berolinensis]|nr:hypothetical protein NC651_010841 [Populus alba x Populus x berolinensis]
MTEKSCNLSYPTRKFTNSGVHSINNHQVAPAAIPPIPANLPDSILLSLHCRFLCHSKHSFSTPKTTPPLSRSLTLSSKHSSIFSLQIKHGLDIYVADFEE